MLNQQTLVYRCPHCGQENELGESLIGEVVSCSNCERPFRVDAPSALPVSKVRAEPARESAGTSEVTQSVQAERTIMVRHPAVFRRNLFQTVLAVLLIVVGLVGVVWGVSTSTNWSGFGGLTMALFGAGVLVYWWILSRFVTLTITSKRSIYRYGLISKYTTEVEHDDVRNIQVSQNVIQRMLNIGEISVSSAGQDTLEIHVRGMTDPNEIVQLIREHQD